MRPQSVLARALPLCAAALLAACGDGGTNASRLSPQQVQGVYNVCTLRFQPTQSALPAANLLATIVNTTPPAPKQPPSLTLSGDAAQYQLLYTRKSDNFLQELRGSVSFGSTNVFANVPDESDSEVRRELLLPGQLILNFTDQPRRLAATGDIPYSVRRSDYARAAGISEEGLQERINGSLSGTFSVGACP
ncbi:MAG TPA: hypothetical protein VF771_18410 [Longimicrobiaceae bacterium]